MFAYHHPFPPFFLCHKSPLSASEATSPFSSVFRALKFQIKLGEAAASTPLLPSPPLFSLLNPGWARCGWVCQNQAFPPQREKGENGIRREGSWGRKRGPFFVSADTAQAGFVDLTPSGEEGGKPQQKNLRNKQAGLFSFRTLWISFSESESHNFSRSLNLNPSFLSFNLGSWISNLWPLHSAKMQ